MIILQVNLFYCNMKQIDEKELQEIFAERKRAADALRFYNDHVEKIHLMSGDTDGFHWDACKSFCRLKCKTELYSEWLFMKYVACHFSTTTDEMKIQMRGV